MECWKEKQMCYCPFGLVILLVLPGGYVWGGLYLYTTGNLNLDRGLFLTLNEKEFLSRCRYGRNSLKQEFTRMRVEMNGSGLAGG